MRRHNDVYLSESQEGDVLIYASDIAKHTRNIKAGIDRVSLVIHDPTQQDSQANARVTIVGDATVVTSMQFTNGQVLLNSANAKKSKNRFVTYRM